jgi:hypothetical protein
MRLTNRKVSLIKIEILVREFLKIYNMLISHLKISEYYFMVDTIKSMCLSLTGLEEV